MKKNYYKLIENTKTTNDILLLLLHMEGPVDNIKEYFMKYYKIDMTFEQMQKLYKDAVKYGRRKANQTQLEVNHNEWKI